MGAGLAKGTWRLRGPYESPVAAGGPEHLGLSWGADWDPTKHRLIDGDTTTFLLPSREIKGGFGEVAQMSPLLRDLVRKCRILQINGAQLAEEE